MNSTFRSRIATLLLTLFFGMFCFGIVFSGEAPMINTVHADPSLITPILNKDGVDNAINQIRPDNAPTLDKKIDSNTSSNSLVGSIKTLLQIAAGLIASFAGTYAVIMLLSHSYKYITSGGDKGKIDGAIKGIQWSLIGLLSISLSYGVINTIINFSFQLASDSSYGTPGAPTTGTAGKTTNPLKVNCPPGGADGSRGPCS